MSSSIVAARQLRWVHTGRFAGWNLQTAHWRAERWNRKRIPSSLTHQTQQLTKSTLQTLFPHHALPAPSEHRTLLPFIRKCFSHANTYMSLHQMSIMHTSWGGFIILCVLLGATLCLSGRQPADLDLPLHRTSMLESTSSKCASISLRTHSRPLCAAQVSAQLPDNLLGCHPEVTNRRMWVFFFQRYTTGKQ